MPYAGANALGEWHVPVSGNSNRDSSLSGIASSKTGFSLFLTQDFPEGYPPGGNYNIEKGERNEDGAGEY